MIRDDIKISRYNNTSVMGPRYDIYREIFKKQQSNAEL